MSRHLSARDGRVRADDGDCRARPGKSRARSSSPGPRARAGRRRPTATSAPGGTRASRTSGESSTRSAASCARVSRGESAARRAAGGRFWTWNSTRAAAAFSTERRVGFSELLVERPRPRPSVRSSSRARRALPSGRRIRAVDLMRLLRRRPRVLERALGLGGFRQSPVAGRRLRVDLEDRDGGPPGGRDVLSF